MRIFALAATATLVVAACGTSATAPPTIAPTIAPTGAPTPEPTSTQLGGEVTVIATWTGDEEASFRAMVKPFEDSTGVKVNYTGTRDLNTYLTVATQSGVLPDVAGLPGPGQMAEYAHAGKLMDLNSVLDADTYKAETSAAFVDLGTVDGKLVGVFIKSAVKGLIWYDPKVYTGGVPASWDDLQAKAQAAVTGGTKPWCVGIESGPASGWPATDWIEDIVIRQSGPQVYDDWVAGKQKWTSPEIKQAFETFGNAVNQAYGGTKTVNATFFGDAGNPLFTTPPGCLFHHQASFITSFFEKGTPGIKAGVDYDFFPFPDINPAYSGAVTGAGDLFGMFNDTPQAAALMRYLVTADAQSIWVARGGALSGNKNVSDYPDAIAKKSAEILTNAKIFRFDGSDLMPPAMNDAFWKATVAYVADQSKLDSILANLDTVQADSYKQ
jgi:alpha-glucoside transport system substrate-binding protein